MSVNHIAHFPQLVDILETDEKLVYLCGAGASMSLGDHHTNWPGWILSGNDYLAPMEQQELKRKAGTWSTTELISAATYLLERLKATDQYRLFMDNTIGSLHPKNREFETALRRIWRAGDLIATTNYDLQIEEAISVKAVSYPSAGDILPIVLGKAENRVIHLHGMYDKLHGIDDIVADDPQYQGVLADAGAQFIQNLIGTHPIMIIGCGGTVEDPNLAGFMSFVTEKLKITNIPYFYVMKEGDGLPVLPPNAIPVYYGTEYEDLPVFLSELALYRLKKRISLKAIASVNPYQESRRAASAFGRIHFSNGFNAFTGRDEEFIRLERFLENPADCLWWAVTGPGGIGKSRLVLEWLRNMPPQWFGFFIKKTGVVENFLPFTDTVIAFDYILGEEKQCAEAVETLFDIFDNSPYKLRVLFIERNKQHSRDSWLANMEQALPAEARLLFDKAKYADDFLEVTGLSEDEEKVYVIKYLQEYLPLLETDPFTEYCRNHTEEAGGEIQRAFRRAMDISFCRPLYLSIFTEVWVAKEGKLVPDNAEDLLKEYLLKEKNRWLTILRDDELVWSYMRLLAVACAIDGFNITDVMGLNYLETDCKVLQDFLNTKSRIPGTQTVFADLFIERDVLEETGDMPDPFFEFFMGGQNSAETDDAGSECPACSGEAANILAAMENDERFAFWTPYIKLGADPEEVYLNMLDQVEMLTEEERLNLQKIREKREEKYNSMPDHAFIISPILPDIIKEYIVAYMVEEWEASRFAKLARSNSVLGFQRFLTRAMEDWPSKELFEKLTVTPPAEILNYFEYYLGIIGNVSLLRDFRPVEKNLYDTDASLCFQRYEMELWRRMAIVLTDRGDMVRLEESGLHFIRYAENLLEHMKVFDTAADVLEAYLVGLHNTGDVAKLQGYLEKCEELSRRLPENPKIGYLCCENYGRLFHLRRYHDRNAETSEDWDKALELLERYHYPEDMCRMAMDFAGEYLHVLVQKKKLKQIRQMEEALTVIYTKHPLPEIAEVLAIATANAYLLSPGWEKERQEREYGTLKRCLADFPDSMRVRSSYISVTNAECSKHEGSRDVPDKVMTRAKDWSEQYPEEIEFQEGYFGLLLTHLRYAQVHGKKNEERRTFSKMKELAEKTDYSEYGEENQMKEAVAMLQIFYGKNR